MALGEQSIPGSEFKLKNPQYFPTLGPAYFREYYSDLDNDLQLHKLCFSFKLLPLGLMKKQFFGYIN